MNKKPEEQKFDTLALQDGINLVSGNTYKLVVTDIMGILAGYLFDQDMVEILPNYTYEIHDDNQKLYEGKTDENGFFMHRDVPADTYTIKANNQDHLIATIDEVDEPVYIAVLNEEGNSED